MPDTLEWWAQAECPKQPGMLTEKLKDILVHFDSRILIWHQTGTSNINKHGWVLNINHHARGFICIPLNSLCDVCHFNASMDFWADWARFLAWVRRQGEGKPRKGTIGGSTGLEPLICLTCNILQHIDKSSASICHWMKGLQQKEWHWIYSIRCLSIPNVESNSLRFNSHFCESSMTMLDQLLPQNLCQQKTCPLASSEASSSQSFFISHCSGLAAGWHGIIQRSRTSKLVDFEQICCARLYIFLYFYTCLFQLHFTRVWKKTSIQ